MAAMTDLIGAIDSFVLGYSFTRSITHPYLREQVGPLWRLYDKPRARGTRREEFISVDTEPQIVDRLARRHAAGTFCLCVTVRPTNDEESIRQEYKKLGYRLTNSEFFMAHPLRRIPRDTGPLPIERVLSQELNDRLTATAGSRQLTTAHLEHDSPIRTYVALDGNQPVAWVTSVVTGPTTWCNNMFVRPEYRRRGIARALMCRMLRDDREKGSDAGILLASHAGAKLYPVVGYVDLGRLLVFVPKAGSTA